MFVVKFFFWINIYFFLLPSLSVFILFYPRPLYAWSLINEITPLPALLLIPTLSWNWRALAIAARSADLTSPPCLNHRDYSIVKPMDAWL